MDVAGRAPNIATARAIRSLTDENLHNILQRGVPGTGMPSFAYLGDAGITQLVQYLRLLQGRETNTAAATGNAGAGRGLFYGSAGCSQCHTVHGDGGFLAPDLSDYADGAAPAVVRQAILTPDERLLPGQEMVEVRTVTGTAVRGVLRSEDNFQADVQTEDGRFHLLHRADIVSLRHTGRSMMPHDYQARLSTADLNDIVSFLVRSAAAETPVAAGSGPAVLGAGPAEPAPAQLSTPAPAQTGTTTASGATSSAPSAPARTFKLEAFDPAFWKLFDRGATLSTMGSGFGFTEGPVWREDGSLLVSDEEKNQLLRLYPDGHAQPLQALGDPDGSTLDADGREVTTASVLRALIRLSADELHYDVIADRFEGHRFNSPNDVVLGPDRALYFTDPTLDLPAGQKQETPFQGVYRVDRTGTVKLLTRSMTQPNGIAFSPDGSLLYISDSAQKNIRRFRMEADGTLSGGEVFADETVAGSPDVPDGVKVDVHGTVFATGPGGVWVWSAAGKHLGTVRTPVQPANLTWGGRDRSTLYLTAGPFVYTVRTRTHGFLPWPAKPGKL